MMADSEALRSELLAHRRRLALLRERAAIEGYATDPSVLLEIQDIERQISQIEAQGVDPDVQAPSNLEQDWLPRLPTAGGDVIVAQVGAGAQHVAVGKHIQQSSLPSDPSRVAASLDAQFDQLDSEVAAHQAGPGATAAMASFQLRLLRGELTKPGDAAPSLPTVRAVVDWLLAQAPQISASLAALMRSPAALQSLARAGPEAITWAAQRFPEQS